MEGKSRRPEITVDPAPRPAAGGGGAVDAAKAASKEPISPGSPSPVSTGRSGKGSRAEGGATLPGWKLDALCRESGSSPAMRERFPYYF
ncbi:hypothetical protein ACP70R_030899 [Stipagrostis hirtigluma subsp. patula]